MNTFSLTMFSILRNARLTGDCFIYKNHLLIKYFQKFMVRLAQAPDLLFSRLADMYTIL
jgi:hypothetical protein